MIEQLREIRDEISLEIQDMSFEELEKYLAENSKIHDASVWKRKYGQNSKTSIAAEPKTKYRKKEK